ncbi:MAG: hypothetical protein M1831_001824 [Alyxoria varia]|nr:MAG: hypothetical protein M1831_001824 [Alyxoria varia]
MSAESFQGVDLSLPAKAPERDQNEETSLALRPFALYTLVSLPDSEYDEAIELSNSKYGDHENSIRRARNGSSFLGELPSLKDVFEYHASEAAKNGVEEMYFAAVVSKDWRHNGLVIVALDDGGMQGDVDSFRIKAENAGSLLVYLQVDTIDWSEAKQEFSIKPQKT